MYIYICIYMYLYVSICIYMYLYLSTNQKKQRKFNIAPDVCDFLHWETTVSWAKCHPRSIIPVPAPLLSSGCTTPVGWWLKIFGNHNPYYIYICMYRLSNIVYCEYIIYSIYLGLSQSMSREYLPYLPGLTADQVILVEDDPQAPQGCRKPVRLGKPRPCRCRKHHVPREKWMV